MIKSDDKPLMEWASYNERFSELLMRGEPLLAHKLAWRMLSQRAQFQSQANRVLNDLYNLVYNFEIDDPEIKNLFDPCWIRKVNIAQVSDAISDSFHTELKDALIDLGLKRDVAGDGKVDGAERLELFEAARVMKVPVIEQLKTVVAHVVRKYLAQCGAGDTQTVS